MTSPFFGAKQIGASLGTAQGIVRYEGFEVNEEKTRVLRSSRRQAVTGIIVNEKTTLNPGELRAFRALLHQVEQKGLEGQNIYNHPNFWEYIKGYTRYIEMVRREAAAPYREQVGRIARKYGLDPKVASDHSLRKQRSTLRGASLQAVETFSTLEDPLKRVFYHQLIEAVY